MSEIHKCSLSYRSAVAALMIFISPDSCSFKNYSNRQVFVHFYDILKTFSINNKTHSLCMCSEQHLFFTLSLKFYLGK